MKKEWTNRELELTGWKGERLNEEEEEGQVRNGRSIYSTINNDVTAWD